MVIVSRPPAISKAPSMSVTAMATYMIQSKKKAYTISVYLNAATRPAFSF